MKHRTGNVIVAIIFTMILISQVGVNTTAIYNSLHVLATIDKDADQYRTGDTVHLTIHVFDKGIPIDPDHLNASYHEYVHYPIILKKIETGVYEGEFLLPKTIAVIVNATNGNDFDSTGFYIFDGVRPPNDSLYVNLAHMKRKIGLITAGDTIDIYCYAYQNNSLVDVDRFEFNSNSLVLNFTRISTGVYMSPFEIPTGLTSPVYYYIQGKIFKGDKFTYMDSSFEVGFFSVWFHKLEQTDSRIRFELFVTDSNGIITSDAKVDLCYSDSTGFIHLPTQTTDDKGRVEYEISLKKGFYPQVQGYVNHSGKTQPFGGQIEYEYESTGFRVEYQGPMMVYPYGQHVTREYRVRSDNNSLVDKKVYYYMTSGRNQFGAPTQYLGAGVKITDGDGKITLSFDAPKYDSYVNIYFTVPFPRKANDQYYDHDENMTYNMTEDFVNVGYPVGWGGYDPKIEIHLGKLNFGTPTPIEVRYPGSSPYDGWEVEVWMWTAFRSYQWSCWANYEILFGHIDNNGNGSIFLPKFLSELPEFSIGIVYHRVSDDRYLSNSITIFNDNPNKENNPSGVKDMSLFYIAIVTISFIMIAVISYRIIRRSNN